MSAHRLHCVRRARRAAQRLVALTFASSLAVLPAVARQNHREAVAVGDLAQQNLSRVAASAAQVAEVLRNNPGVMVELKRWVAKEATDKGQVIEDGDLSDQAIYSRLDQDVEFRSVATRLVQRYGYLLPKINPDSDVAKEAENPETERTGRESDGGARAGVRRLRARETPPQPGDAQPLREKSVPAIPPERITDTLQAAAARLPVEPGAAPSPHLADAAAKELGLPEAVPGMESYFPGERLARALESEGSSNEDAAGSSILSGPERVSAAGRQPHARREAELETPAMVRRPNPYAGIPSLYDLYWQAPQQPARLDRFGLEVFRNATAAGADFLPMDLPVGPNYVVGPGDGLAIDIWGGIAQRMVRTVNSDGRVTLPEVGPVLVSGQTLGEVQRSVQQILRTQFRDVSADVSLARLRSVRVYVVGDVAYPGAYDISSLSTPLNALFQAGGPTDKGSVRTVRHYRGKDLVQEVDVYDLLLRGVRGDMNQLRDGDTVLVPPLGPQVKVEGLVRRPAVYELRGETPLAEVLELAGGILPIATLRNIQVHRLEAHEKHTMISLDLPERGDSEAMRQQLQSFAARDGDEIRIYPILQHNLDAVYLLGHALRPGRYAYREGMRVTDLLSSYKDLLPEPAPKYAEIIRLNQPDFRPSVESFDLEAALANPSTAPKLQPMDTVQVFSRYDFEEPPTVRVGGEVYQPGGYRTSGRIHLRDAVHLAGGLTPNAQTESAQLFRRLPDGKLQILSLNLAAALAGNPLENLLLEPRDHILIHRSLEKVDPPTVYVKGEVAKPGRYPLAMHMRLADLIRLAGGLKRSAYTETADLTRYLAEGEAQTTGLHLDVSIAGALSGDPDSNLLLRNGDMLAIRQISGWDDIGASIVVEGEVPHPGTYGIQPGEKLSSVLQRAGGFLPTAYPQGAALERVEVRGFQEQAKADLIRRLEQESTNIRTSISESAQEQASLQQAAAGQRQQVLEVLRRSPVTGRLVIRLQGDFARFVRTPDDIELRAGDRLVIPKRPNFVIVTGQVYNANAIVHVPRKNAGWYLERAGGPTDLAEKKSIFIVRANGEVVSGNRGSWWGGGVLSQKVQAGDIIVVPERAIGGSTFWRNFVAIAQVASSAAIGYAVATR